MMTDDRGGLAKALGDKLVPVGRSVSVRRLLHQSSELIDNIAELTDKRAKLKPRFPGSLRKRHYAMW